MAAQSTVVVETGGQLKILDVDADFLELFCFEKEQLVGRSLRMLYGPCTDTQTIMDFLAAASGSDELKTTPQNIFAALYDSNGGLRLIIAEAGKREHGTCVLRMQQSHAIDFKAARADDGSCKMILSTETRRVEDVSMAFTERYGFSLKTAQGRTPGSLIQGPGSDLQSLTTAMTVATGGLTQRIPLLTFSSDCSAIPVIITVTPVHDGSGRLSQLVLTLVVDRPARRICSGWYVAASCFDRRSVKAKIALLCLALPATLNLLGGPIIASGHTVVSASQRPNRQHSHAGHLFDSENAFSRYRDYVPPVHALGGPRDDGLQKMSANNKMRANNKITLMIDLDKTALYGNDGNDLGVALQWMDKEQAKVEELYRKLINPSLRPMYNSYVKQGKEVEVIVYTRRPQVVYYKSCVRQNTVPVRYADEWHGHDGQLYLPSSLKTSDDIFKTYTGPELLEDEIHDVKLALDRLLAARNGVMHELGLAVPPRVVVTAAAKHVETTARFYGLSPDACLLFDDNIELRNAPQVVLVNPHESLQPDRRAGRHPCLFFIFSFYFFLFFFIQEPVFQCL
jgi:hypothetical protein